MDTEALNAFVTVNNCRSFSIAANQMHLTQPAVSKRIASLEQSLGHELFNRGAKFVTLTEAGEQLLPRAKAILLAIKDTKASMLSLSGNVSGTLKVATSHHIGLHHLPPMLRSFASQYPQVDLQIEFLDSEVAHQRVLEGECDLAVVTLAPGAKIDKIKSEVLWQDSLKFVAAKDHHLISQKSISLACVSRSPAILPSLSTYTGRIAKEFFEARKLPIRMNMTTNYLETIKMMVSVGLGWSLLPETLIDDHLRIIPVDTDNLTRDLGVITHTKRSLSNASRVFHDILSTETQKT